MGFLDHSTNNIILDAVLTDKGREFLSRNDGSFNVTKFALGDDEVDYTLIEKFGRTVGKEKVEKNTPILEALTNPDQALKYKLVSLSVTNLTTMPNLSLKNKTSNTVSLNIVDTRSDSVTVKQSIGTGTDAIPVELVDQVFSVKVNNLFLQLSSGRSPVSINSDNIATYLVKRDSDTDSTTGGSLLTITPTVKTSLTTTMFDTYGTQTDKTNIRTVVTVTGLQSAQMLDIVVTIGKTA
jgi:hypothetical protein